VCDLSRYAANTHKKAAEKSAAQIRQTRKP
jgi:hypothetical protein